MNCGARKGERARHRGEALRVLSFATGPAGPFAAEADMVSYLLRCNRLISSAISLKLVTRASSDFGS